MACWLEEPTMLLRALIFDLDEATERYSDARLSQILVVASQLVMTEISFETTYALNIRTQEITPSPTSTDTRDDTFISLITLKAACIISVAEANQAANAGITVQDGINKFSSGDKIKAKLQLMNQGYCKQYADSKTNFALASAVLGQAVLSPFNPGNVDNGYFDYWRNRRC